MSIPYTMKAAVRLEMNDPEGAINELLDGMGHYAELVKELVNDTHIADAVLLVAAMKAVTASLEDTFSEEDTKMAETLMNHIAVIRIEMPDDENDDQ